MSLIKTTMNIPDQYNIKKTIEQKTYLVDGQLKTWSGETANIYSTISSTESYQPTLLGSIPQLGEEQANEALDAACNAFNKGKGLWPTMKVVDRIACMDKFVFTDENQARRDCKATHVGNRKNFTRFRKRI